MKTHDKASIIFATTIILFLVFAGSCLAQDASPPQPNSEELRMTLHIPFLPGCQRINVRPEGNRIQRLAARMDSQKSIVWYVSQNNNGVMHYLNWDSLCLELITNPTNNRYALQVVIDDEEATNYCWRTPVIEYEAGQRRTISADLTIEEPCRATLILP